MKTVIDIAGTNEKTESFVKPIKEVLRHILKSLEFNEKKAALSIYVEFVTPEYIKDINKEQRGIDAVTDVLSFPALENKEGKLVYDEYDIDLDRGELFLGDILICEDRLFSQALEYGHAPVRESVFLASHGLMHLLGYDHTKEEDEKLLRDVQEKALKELGYDR
ncbi:MAG: rRNA maturation RNase YbeY [Clostridia bacterium]